MKATENRVEVERHPHPNLLTQELALGLKLMLRAVSKESFEPGSPILQTLRAARMTEEIHQNSPASVGPIAWLAAVCSPAESDDYKPLNGISLDAAASQFPCLRCFLRQAWLSHWFLTMKTPMEKIAQPYVSVSFVKAFDDLPTAPAQVVKEAQKNHLTWTCCLFIQLSVMCCFQKFQTNTPKLRAMKCPSTKLRTM